MLQHGICPQPLGSVGTSRVDARGIAEAAAITLTTEGHNGEVYNLVGPEALTDRQIAKIWSKALAMSVTCAGDDLDAWEQQSLQYLPAWMVFDFRLMYEYFQKNGLKATPEDIARQTKLLGHAPRSFEGFAVKTANMRSVMA